MIVGASPHVGGRPALGKMATKAHKNAARLDGRYWQSRARWRHYFDVQATASTMIVGNAFISPTAPPSALFAHSSDRNFCGGTHSPYSLGFQVHNGCATPTI
jgi:hypothetical protein